MLICKDIGFLFAGQPNLPLYHCTIWYFHVQMQGEENN